MRSGLVNELCDVRNAVCPIRPEANVAAGVLCVSFAANERSSSPSGKTYSFLPMFPGIFFNALQCSSKQIWLASSLSGAGGSSRTGCSSGICLPARQRSAPPHARTQASPQSLYGASQIRDTAKSRVQPVRQGVPISPLTCRRLKLGKCYAVHGVTSGCRLDGPGRFVAGREEQ